MIDTYIKYYTNAELYNSFEEKVQIVAVRDYEEFVPKDDF